MGFDFAKPFKITMPIPFTDGQLITLKIRRPTWDEGDEIQRRMNEHNLRVVQLYRDLAPPDEAGGSGQEAMMKVQPEQRMLILNEVKKLERTMNREIAAQVMDFIVGFEDKDEHGQPIFTNDGEAILSQDKKVWGPLLQEALAPALPALWDKIAENVKPNEYELKFQSDIAKNSTPASSS